MSDYTVMVKERAQVTSRVPPREMATGEITDHELR